MEFLFHAKIDSYGALAPVKNIPGALNDARPSHRRLDIIGILIVNIIPWIFFTCVYWMMSMRFHFTYPIAAWGLVGLAALMCLWLHALSRNHHTGWWFGFLAFTMTLALVAAVGLGDANFWFYSQPYYVINDLNSYVNVDPSKILQRGSQYMDAGRMYFTPTAMVDTSRAIGFKNGDVYCVAPIVLSEKRVLPSYDFWAVGKNCCNGLTPDFRCGEYRNPRAKSGLRMMSEMDRRLYRLAVMKASSAYDLVAAHPLFFFWVEDPVVEANTYRDTAWANLVVGIIAHFVAHTIMVASAATHYNRKGQEM
mmetsp:Transcript_41763/g.100229  ORF Transcript_41763/g.100229 Transcript_41763/m.100229 type:complete len:308 (+) Transcript_41763:92-1015(+)